MDLIEEWIGGLDNPVESIGNFLEDLTGELERRIKALEVDEHKVEVEKAIGDLPYGVPLNAWLVTLLDHRLGSDVTILIGSDPTPYQAHKIVLACSSSFFSDLFYKANHSDESDPLEIQLPDHDIKNFGLILQYVYKECLPDISLSTAEVVDLVYAGRTFCIPGLLDYLQGFIASFISTESVAEMLELALDRDLPKLETACWDYIEALTMSVLDNNLNLHTITSSTLLKLLDRDYLNASEYQLFRFIHEWTQQQCATQNISPTPENLIKVGGAAYERIRYATMTPLRFTKTVVPTQVLTATQLLNVYLYMNAPDDLKPSSIFNPYRRKIRNPTKDRHSNTKCPARGWKVNRTDGQIMYSKQKLVRMLSHVVTSRDAITRVFQIFYDFFSAAEEGGGLFFDE